MSTITEWLISTVNPVMAHLVRVSDFNRLSVTIGYLSESRKSRYFHRHGNCNCSPKNIIRGATSTSCSPIFFCNLQLKVQTKQTKFTFNTKIPRLLGPSPRPYCTLLKPLSKNTCCKKLYFEFDCLDCFSPIPQPKSHSIFAPPTEKLFLCL